MKRRRNVNSLFSPTRILLGVLVLLFLAYALFVAVPLFQKPIILAHEPLFTDHGTVRIEGTVERVTALSINELSVSVTEDGYFAVERAFPSGYTVVTLEGVDRFGRAVKETLTFVTHNQSHEHVSKKENDEKNSSESGDEGDEKERGQGSEAGFN